MLKISKQNNSPLSFRQKQLQKHNFKLQEQLKIAYQTINKLRNQIEQLKNHIQFLQLENQKNNRSHSRSNRKELKLSPKSKSNKSLKLVKDFHQQIQIFTSQSDSQNQQYTQFKPISSGILPLGRKYQPDGRQNSRYYHDQQDKIGSLSLIKQKSSQIKLRGKPSNQKTLKKIDSSNLFHPINYFDIDPDQDIHVSGILQRQNKQNFFSMSNINLHKSQKLISIGTQNKQFLTSAIKQQSKIKQPSEQKIFKKVTIAKPIYSVFFVTGLNKMNQPHILFSYPQTSPHFQPILSLCYSDQFLKVKQNSSNSNQIFNQSTVGNPIKIKDFYVIPLRKLDQQNTQNQRQYLTVCEVQEIVLIEKQNSMIPCVFQRLYCFISSCQFFNCFKNLINQFLDKINSVRIKQKNQTQYLKEEHYKSLLHECLEQPLTILSQKSAQSNHTLNYRLDSYISIAIDIPSLQNSYKMVSQYRPWGVMNFKVQLRPLEEYISCLETKLFGVILAYALSQKKIILYSNVKSKISQCILHLLQIIKPLDYVCPILMTALKQNHEQYFSAPMSLIIGLWSQQKKMQRQKIQIFMNRRQNLAGMIQKGKISISDGLIYGGGLSQSLSSLSLKINQYYQNYCHHPKQVFKLFQKLFEKQCGKNQIQIFDLQQSIKQCLEGTQLYSYYKQKSNKKYHGI